MHRWSLAEGKDAKPLFTWGRSERSRFWNWGLGWGAFGDQYGSVIPSRFSHSDRSRKSFARTEPGAKDESPAAMIALGENIAPWDDPTDIPTDPESAETRELGAA